MIEALHGDHYEVIDECEAYACNIYYLFMLLIYQPMWSFFFFFQAEDGIRYYKVTGVQTCALPISIEVTLRMPGEVTGNQTEEIHCTARVVHVRNEPYGDGRIGFGAEIVKFSSVPVEERWMS